MIFWFSDFRAVSTIGFVRKNYSQKPIPKTTHHKIFHSSHFSPLPFPLSSQSEPPFPILNCRFKGKSGPGEYLQLFAFGRIIFNGSPTFCFATKNDISHATLKYIIYDEFNQAQMRGEFAEAFNMVTEVVNWQSFRSWFFSFILCQFLDFFIF